MLRCCFFRATLLVSLIAIPAGAKSPVPAAEHTGADVQSNQEFRAQVAAIVQAYREGDTTRGRALVEHFRLPNAQGWFSEHLNPVHSADFTSRYDRLYANFAESFERTVEAVVANRGAELNTSLDIGESETPTVVLRPGAKLSGILSTKPVELFLCQFQITIKKKPATSWEETCVRQDRCVSFHGLWWLAFLGMAKWHRGRCVKVGTFRHATYPGFPS